MAASKAESQKVFEKLKLKPANKVRLCPSHPRSVPGHGNVLTLEDIDMLRLRFQESHLVFGSFRYLLVP